MSPLLLPPQTYMLYFKVCGVCAYLSCSVNVCALDFASSLRGGSRSSKRSILMRLEFMRLVAACACFGRRKSMYVPLASAGRSFDAQQCHAFASQQKTHLLL